MKNSARDRNWILSLGSGSASAVLAIAIVLALATVVPQLAQAQTFNVLYRFPGGQVGVNPVSGLSMDRSGSLYGTTNGGGIYGGTCGNYGCGTVFKLTHSGSGWILRTLYRFAGGSDGADPQARVVFGPDGSLYGTTAAGGQGVQATVFNLRPPITACKAASCLWSETVLYDFTGGADGATPNYGDVVFDQAGNLYGATINGGDYNDGVVYELTHSGGGWTESVLHSFAGVPDGGGPYSGVIFDKAGNLYGTTIGGGDQNYGTVYRLTPSGSGWAENILYNFQADEDGAFPFGGMVFDSEGHLYGTACALGANGGGTVFELTPSNGVWTFAVLFGLSGSGNLPGPSASLTMDAGGNLYGTAMRDGAYNYGSVFKLTPSMGGWIYTDLHDFTGRSDGEYPYSNVIFDASGNLYGTAQGGGIGKQGVVWNITP